MCGRFLLLRSGQALADHFGLDDTPSLPLRYNIAPTQSIPVVRVELGFRSLAMLKWSLTPSGSTDGRGFKNARAETAASNPAFRSPFRKRRCLIPASGFYEWKDFDATTKQPYCIRQKGHDLLAFAAIWDEWHNKYGAPIESCAILTTEANALLRPIHNRMPCIVQPCDYAAWLDAQTDIDALQKLLTPFAASELRAVPVSTYVNNARHDGPLCVAPA
jgi:putative SOS response-associated peptidase YedK